MSVKINLKLKSEAIERQCKNLNNLTRDIHNRTLMTLADAMTIKTMSTVLGDYPKSVQSLCANPLLSALNELQRVTNDLVTTTDEIKKACQLVGEFAEYINSIADKKSAHE